MPESHASPERPHLSLFIEQWGPILAGLISVVVLCFFANSVVDNFVTGAWKSSGLYTAIFDWAAIQTGFAFGVYGFVAGRRDGFVGALQGTVAMARFMSYVKRANAAGFMLTFMSIPLIVLSPSISAPFSVNFIVVVIWFSAFVWAFCAFLRLAYNFGRMASVNDKVFHGA